MSKPEVLEILAIILEIEKFEANIEKSERSAVARNHTQNT